MGTQIEKFGDLYLKASSNWRALFSTEKDFKEFYTVAWQVCKIEGFNRDNASPQYYRSLWNAIGLIASLHLKPGKQYGHIDMHIEKEKGLEVVACRPMYQGFLDIAYRDDELTYCKAEIVREGETFEDNGINAVPTHKKDLKGSGKIIGSYAVAMYKDGHGVREILAQSDLDKIKKHITDKTYEKKLSGIAVTWEEEWAKIKAIRRLLKSLRRTYTLEEITALEHLDNQDYKLEA